MPEIRKIPYTWKVKHPHVIYGNSLSSVVVCIVYPFRYPDRGREVTNEDRLMYQKYMELCRKCVDWGAAVAGLQNTEFGIVYVVRTCLDNPNIRWLIVVGKDHGHKIMTMYRQLRNAYVLKRKGMPIVAVGEPLAKYVDVGIANVFVEKVGVICIETDDPLREEDRLKQLITACIQEPENKVVVKVDGVEYELYDPGAHENTSSTVKFPTQKYVWRYVSNSIAVVESLYVDEAWEAVLEIVDRYGIEVEDVRGRRKYLPVTLLVSSDPNFEDEVLEHAVMNSVKDLILSAEKSGDEVYTYGHRMLKYFGYDQLSKAVEKLARKEVSRAYISLYDPFADSHKEDVPCLVSVQLYWSVPREEVSLAAYFRSWDVGRAFPWNMGMLAHVLWYTAEKLREYGLEVRCGRINVVTPCAHVYL